MNDGKGVNYYVPNLFELNLEEPEQYQQSCSGFFLANLGHANPCSDHFHWWQ